MAYLRAFFKARPHLGNRLDLLVLTHPHKDHTRGVPGVIAEFAPKKRDPQRSDGDPSIRFGPGPGARLL